MTASEKLRALDDELQRWTNRVDYAAPRILNALPQIVAVVKADEFAASKQQEALAIIEQQGFVFDDIGREPGNWKHLAFTLYSLLCEIESHSSPALDALDEELG